MRQVSTVVIVGPRRGERDSCSPIADRCLMSSPIRSVVPSRKGKVILKLGIFPRIPAPECESFALHRHDWQGVHEGVDQYKIKLFDEKL